ncbi:beta-1,2-xylosyltransferase [Microdochium nivale]|nr:beta-1,2-xylosyltransferase [Microdochium nivale]
MLLSHRLASLPGSRYCSSAIALRYGAIAAIFVIFITALSFSNSASGLLISAKAHYFDYFSPRNATHPIETLITEARKRHADLLTRQPTDLADAARRYRERRGRHPPPGFDAWFNYAVKHDSLIVENYFDRIYADLRPFWAFDPKQTAERAATWHHVIKVRNGRADGRGNTEGLVPWLQLWTGLVAEAAPWLPDVDMPINMMDESRLLVPWEDVAGYVQKEGETRRMPPVDQVMTEFTGLFKVDAQVGELQPHDPEWLHEQAYWDMTRATCDPKSPSRGVEQVANLTAWPVFPEKYRPEYQYFGYVKNFTASTDVCHQPHIRALHGTFIEPLSVATSKELIPLFGGSKLPNNNEIIIPGAMYITDDPFYSGGKAHGPPWADKKDGIVWRGVGSGGRHKAENWSHFQRHRLVQMLNGTTVSGLEEEAATNGNPVARAPTFQMPSMQKYDFPRRRNGEVGAWLSEFADAGFVDLLCFPKDDCAYLDEHYSTVESIPMAEQYKMKFIPDVDGNSFSARFRGLVSSTSLPLKATVYTEWHDDRLLPWLHFVPLDNTLQDLYGVLDYFTRDDNGDRAARFLAEEGTIWSAKVLRREDMVLYTWRLLLEFARVCDAGTEKADKSAER